MIGASIRRLEDRRLLTGAGRYIADVQRPGMVSAVVVRSPHAHARILRIDLARVRAHPGVIDAITAADLGDRDRRIPLRMAASPALAVFLQPPLARDRVRYAGEPVAVVVATDPYVARDAADLVDVEYEGLTAVVDPLQGAEAAAPALHEHGNVAATWVAAAGDVEQALREAAHVVRRTFRTNRHTGVPMETRGLLAEYDASGAGLTMWGPTKVPYFNRRVLSGLLDLPEERIRFIEGDVGGGFGVRGEFYPEDFLVPFLAIRLGRPVRWIEDRREHFSAINHSREQRWDFTAAAATDGRLLALDATLVNDMGAYVRTHGTLVARVAAANLPGPYVVPNLRCRVTCVTTNTTPTGTMRAPGHYEVNFAREQMLDVLAGEAGLDRAELRRRNLVRPEQMPYTTGAELVGHPMILDTGNYPSVFDRALRRSGYPELSAERAAANRADNGVRLGVGIACIAESSGVGPHETARVQVTREGAIIVDTGATSQGQGHETTLAQVCADVLGCPAEGIVVRHGDTALLPTGEGTYASRAAIMAGSAVHGAAVRLKAEILERAAAMLEASPHDLVLRDGRVGVAGVPARTLSLAEVAAGASPLEVLYYHEASKKTASFSVHVATVAVDLATGRVEPRRYWLVSEIGRAINPLIVEGQLRGGLIHGLGGALGEELVYDEAGQLVTGTLMDYALLAAADGPLMDIDLVEESPALSNPLGVKGVGEAGTGGAAAALASAVADAVGSEISRLPLTSARVHRVIQSALALGGRPLSAASTSKTTAKS